MYLDRMGFKYAEYLGEVYRIFSEINYKRNEIDLLNNDNRPFTADFSSVYLISPDSEDHKILDYEFKKTRLIYKKYLKKKNRKKILKKIKKDKK